MSFVISDILEASALKASHHIKTVARGVLFEECKQEEALRVRAYVCFFLKQMEIAVSGERQRDIPARRCGGEKVVEALR